MTEAGTIISIYENYDLKSDLYLIEDQSKIDNIFEDVVVAIENSGPLKLQLPKEFVRPSRQYCKNDPAYIKFFNEKDNKRFFLSDVYDYLKLFFR